MKIRTHYDPPPIPIRDFDWTATSEDYDPGEPDELGNFYGSDPVGTGATESEAIADLMQILKDQSDEIR